MSKKTTTGRRKSTKVFVVGGGFEYIRLLYGLGFDAAFNVETADVVLFTGGEDVDPQLYGERPLTQTHFNPNRDKIEIDIYKKARDLDIPMVGICRGGQFLNVMNGGKMWQHVNGHANGRHIATRQDKTNPDGSPISFEVTSTHHQMMIPGEDAMILMDAEVCSNKQSYGKAVDGRLGGDVEVVWYDKTNCLCFQPHPEYGYASPELVDFFDELLDNFVLPMVPTETHRSILLQTKGE